MAEYIVKDTELTSIANAIRAKSGGNSQLEFPNGFVSEIGNVVGDFTAEWQRPSDWLPLPNDIGTYAGIYFLYKVETGKTIYKVRVGGKRSIDIGITDSSGNFTTLLTQSNSGSSEQTAEIDISNLQIGDYFWIRGTLIAVSLDSHEAVINEPVVESIISNSDVSFYEGTIGTLINTRTLHFIANKWISNYAYNFDCGQNIKCFLQCVEFYGGSWSNNITLPQRANKIVIDDVDVTVKSGKIFNNDYGRGSSMYGYAQYKSVDINTQTSLRMNFSGGSTSEAQSLLNKLGDLSGITNFENFWKNAFNVTALNFTGNKITNATNFKAAFSNCKFLRNITWGETDLSNITSLSSTFDGALSIESISIPWTIHITENNGMYLAFRDCHAVETIDISKMDFTSNVTFGSCFAGCKNLKNLTFKSGAGIAQPISVNNSNQLTVESLLSLFNALATISSAKTCSIGSTNLAKLTAEQKAIATDKGWTLS